MQVKKDEIPKTNRLNISKQKFFVTPHTHVQYKSFAYLSGVRWLNVEVRLYIAVALRQSCGSRSRNKAIFSLVNLDIKLEMNAGIDENRIQYEIW